MGKKPIYVGLEIGTSMIAVVVAESRSDGTLRIIGSGEAPSRGVRKGEIVESEKDKVQKCVQDAIRLAEDRSDVEIESVYLSLTGGHIMTVNHRGCVRIPEEREFVNQDDVAEIKIIARDVNLPAGHAFLHTLVRRYYIDGQQGVADPVGSYGQQLEADYHVIHGEKARMQRAISFVQEIGLQVEEVVFAPLASSQVMLTDGDKKNGALVIDFGGGTTDYLLYENGTICQSGSLGVGGDHILNDIVVVIDKNMPFPIAEQLKVQYGSAQQTSGPDEHVVFEDESGLHVYDIYLEDLESIISARVEETFLTLKRMLVAKGYLRNIGAGIFLTGGGSQLKGLAPVVETIFDLPVVRGARAQVSGVTTVSEDPQFTTALGLVRYAQMQNEIRPRGSILRRVGSVVGGIFGPSR